MAKTFLEERFPDAPRDRVEYDGKLFACSDLTLLKGDGLVTSCRGHGHNPPCIYATDTGDPRPCRICSNIGKTYEGRSLLFHDTGEVANG